MLSPPESVRALSTAVRGAREHRCRGSARLRTKVLSGMAYDLQRRFNRLRTVTQDSFPTSTTSQPVISRNNANDNAIRPIHGESAHPSAEAAETSGNYPLSMRSVDIDTSWLGCGKDGNHITASPINVPTSSSKDSLLVDRSIHHSRYHDPSPLEEFLINRRPSISFNPQVTLESGERRGLEEPLPEVGLNPGFRSPPILQELSRHSPRSPLCRFYSHGESDQYGSFTGRPQFRTRLTENRSRYPQLQPNEYGIASDKGQTEYEQGVSLTSASTASPLRSEIQTPLDGTMDCLISPMSPFSPFNAPTSLEDSNPWPIIQRQGSLPPRAKSFSLNRKGSGRQSCRQSSRRSSASSANSSASAYLSRFAREEAVVEPDAEGQEVGEYVLGKSIGYGGFSVVKEAYTIEDGKRVCRAVKIVRKQVVGKEDIENEQYQAEFEREVDLWRCLNHRHILPLIAVHVTNFATFCFSKLNSGGNLFDLVRVNRQGLHPNLARRYTYQLASAIRYLHEDMRIVHRDIKLENCLVDMSGPNAVTEGGHLLLCDFGMAEFITDENSRESSAPYESGTDRPRRNASDAPKTSTSITGSLEYASPEIILGPINFLSRVGDVWAFGVVVYALLVGDLPFQHILPPRVRMMIICGEWNREALQRAGESVGMENEVTELVHGCLDMNSERRLTIGRVLDSRWLNGCEEMLEEIHAGWKQ